MPGEEACRLPVGCKGETLWTLVDPDTAERFATARLFANVAGYALLNVGERQARLHRLILGLTWGDGLICDHIDGNRLDNRRTNLRVVTAAENSQNRALDRRNQSGFLGVSYDYDHRKWRATAHFRGKQHGLGRFRSREAAALAVHEFRLAHVPGYVPERVMPQHLLVGQ